MYHISDIKKMERCEKLYWLAQRKKISFVPFVNYNENMLDLIKTYFMIHTCFEGHPNDDGTLALEAMKTQDILLNARFSYADLRVKIPLMIRGEAGWNVYFSYNLCYPREGEAQRIADHICVLEACGITIENCYAIHLNADYVREASLDVHALIVVTPYLYNVKNHANHTILDLVKKYKRNVFSYLPRLKELDTCTEIKSVRQKSCTRGGKCAYYQDCFPNEQETSIHRLFGAKLELLEKGITSIADVEFEQLEGTRQQYAQYMAAKTNALYIDRFALQHWIKQVITYPISYLDFEWETFAFPPYQGMRPFDVLTFQYSLHVEEEHKASLAHYEFLGEQDCREAFIQQLLQEIPKTGTILVYNMEGAEKLRLKQLAQQFPKYQKELDALCDRMVDLSLPFSTGNIYDNRMDGYFSLKKLVDVFSEYSYQDLAISYGMDAVSAWRELAHMEEPQKSKTKDELLAYCAMDTYGEVIVFHKILSLLQGEDK